VRKILATDFTDFTDSNALNNYLLARAMGVTFNSSSPVLPLSTLRIEGFPSGARTRLIIAG
jgi:hypothetical protein